MEKTALDQALDQLDKAVAAVRLGVADLSQAERAADAAGGAAHAVSGGAIDPFVFRFAIFVLAICVGYYVVWSVTPALHTPLMSVTIAISGIIVVGGMLQVSGDMTSAAVILGGVSILLATINVAGGFLVTQRMLRMFSR